MYIMFDVKFLLNAFLLGDQIYITCKFRHCSITLYQIKQRFNNYVHTSDSQLEDGRRLLEQKAE